MSTAGVRMRPGRVCDPYHHARVAQSAERLTRNEQVKGSIPFSGSPILLHRKSERVGGFG